MEGYSNATRISDVEKQCARLKGLDTSKGDGKDKQHRFERVIAFTGDFLISDESKDDVLDRLKSFIDNKQRENPAIKAQSIELELS